MLKVFEVIVRTGKNLGAEKMLTKLTLLTIKSYQSHISPHKGFSCAYRQLYGEQSCSAYFYSCVLDTNLSTASNLIQQRLNGCQQAYTVWQSNKKSNYQKPSKKQKHQKNSHECDDCHDWIDLGSCLYVCDPIDCGDCGDCGDCDLGFCDF